MKVLGSQRIGVFVDRNTLSHSTIIVPIVAIFLNDAVFAAMPQGLFTLATKLFVSNYKGISHSMESLVEAVNALVVRLLISQCLLGQ